MIKIGLTGGIGSGKSTVAEIFSSLHIPVFYSDDAAKKLMNTDPGIQRKLTDWYGPEAYEGGELNRMYLAQIIFANPEEKEKVNHLVHPVVRKAFNDFVASSNSPYVINEAAILFETGAYHQFDANILVVAPEKLRIERVQNRDNLPIEAIEARVKQQWSDDKKKTLADYVIINDGSLPLIPQVLEIHEDIIRSAN